MCSKGLGRKLGRFSFPRAYHRMLFFYIRELVSPLYYHNTLQLVLLRDNAPPSSTRCDIRGRPGDEHQGSVPLKVPTAEKCRGEEDVYVFCDARHFSSLN